MIELTDIESFPDCLDEAEVPWAGFHDCLPDVLGLIVQDVHSELV